ncbi:vegetative cell wall protein gp1-like [Oryza brachyantha]|uniref:Bifunctional inhibitor/plant lipid transfer protein/seed storage helical domain-containing protein n=1 Tax=Oryza brachyantha TaxID=4533 RepID=J3MGY1_ORYBR|nr:vegetative cell wall protein gp1-like [Oryza brachyantha]
MAPSSKLTALFFAFALVAATLAPPADARVRGFNQEAASEPAVAGESKIATGGPGLLGILFPFLMFPFLGGGGGAGAPPSAGGFPIPAAGSSGSSGSGFQFPFPLPLPHPSSPGAPPSTGSGFPFPMPFPFPFQQPSSPGTPPSQPSPASPSSPSSSAPPPSPAPEQPKECLTPMMSMMPCAEYLTNSTMQTPPATCCEGFKSLANKAAICLCHGINGDLSKLLPLPLDLMKMMTLPNTCRATVPLQTFSLCNTPAVPPLMPPSPSAPAPAN